MTATSEPLEITDAFEYDSTYLKFNVYSYLPGFKSNYCCYLILVIYIESIT